MATLKTFSTRSTLKSGILNRPLTDEGVREKETERAKLNFIVDEILKNESLLEIFEEFGKLEFVENELVFQNILYFVGYTGENINEENTNKLKWKFARNFWNKAVLEKLKEYDPYGEKEKVQYFSLVNRLIAVFEEISPEAVLEYSYVISRLVEFMKGRGALNSA